MLTDPTYLPKYPAGSVVPYFVDIALYPNYDQSARVITKTPDLANPGNFKQFNDIQIEEVYVASVFKGWNIFGHSTIGTTTNDDLYVILVGAAVKQATPYIPGQTNYTNGFDISQVLPALQQRLGWMQPTIAGSPVLTSPNTISTSGRYFGDDFHALCTIKNIKANQEDPAISDANFNTYLINKQNGMIMRALTETFRKPELLEQCLMYTRFGMNDVPLPNQGNFCGWCIDVANDQSLSTQITMGTFYFDQNVTFNMYLFQDGIRTPLKTIAVTVAAWQHTEVDFSQLVLNFKTGMRYYFVYNQTELGSARAIREQIEIIAATKCFKAFSIQMPPTTDGSVFNINAKQYPALPMGVNLEIITFKDHTQKIIRMANLFDEVQGLQMAAFAMELVNNNTRSNSTERLTEQRSQQAFMELNQSFATKEVPVTPGLKSRIMAEFKKLRDTFYPPAVPTCISMESDCDGLDSYEQNWRKQNASVANNPGVFIQ